VAYSNPEKVKEAQRRWRAANREKLRIRARARYRANIEKERVRVRAWHVANPDYAKQYEKSAKRRAYKARLEKTDHVQERRRLYRMEHSRAEYHQQYERAYRARRKELHNLKQACDLQYRLRRAVRARLRQAIRKNQKQGSAVESLGCTIDFLRVYLEKQFLPGMTWSNFGRLDGEQRTWQIDHIHPLSAFDLTDPFQLIQACHYTNLAPMWAIDNRRKGNRIERRLEIENVL